MTRDFGNVDFEGITYTLTQDAYCDNYGTDGGVRYYAHAVDGAGNKYLLAWDTTQAWMDAEDCDDESNACDWSSPVAAELLEEAE
jgi:hypothetical protein